LSHAYATASQGAGSVPVAVLPAYSTEATIANVPAGTYVVWAQVAIESNAGTGGICRLAVNGSADTATATGFWPNNQVADLTLVSPEALTGGGSTVGVECAADDPDTGARVHLALVAVDALN
jgi:hypothetical protein